MNKSTDNFIVPPSLGTWVLKSHESVVQDSGGHCEDTKGRIREGFVEEVTFVLHPDS